MKRMRLIILAVALVAALLAAYLASGLISSPAPQQVAVANTVDVLIAGRDVGAGERLGSDGLQWKAWPRDGVTSGMITRDASPDALSQMQLSRAGVPLTAGEPILSAKILPAAEAGYMSSLLPEGRRAVSVQITDVSSAGGFVLPNDRVDVILSRQISDAVGNKRTVTETVLTNVKVLAINQKLASGGDGASIPDVRFAVLEIEPRQAEVLTRVASQGQITLALRSIEDEGNMKPVLDPKFSNSNRVQGPLIIRYGLERSQRGQ